MIPLKFKELPSTGLNITKSLSRTSTHWGLVIGIKSGVGCCDLGLPSLTDVTMYIVTACNSQFCFPRDFFIHILKNLNQIIPRFHLSWYRYTLKHVPKILIWLPCLLRMSCICIPSGVSYNMPIGFFCFSFFPSIISRGGSCNITRCMTIGE